MVEYGEKIRVKAEPALARRIRGTRDLLVVAKRHYRTAHEGWVVVRVGLEVVVGVGDMGRAGVGKAGFVLEELGFVAGEVV